MAQFAPPAVVAGAPRVELPYGLFSVLAFRPDGQDRWMAGGVTWEYISCGADIGLLGAIDDEGRPATGLPKVFPARENEPGATFSEGDVGKATTFGVYGTFLGTPISWPYEEALRAATDDLITFEQRKVETEFWNNTTTGASPDLNTDTTAVSSVALGDLHYGVADLERWIGETYGSLGVMHMGRDYAQLLLTKGALRRDGTRLITELGTPVVAGAGYPEGAIKASPALFGYRSEIIETSNRAYDGLDRNTNDLHALAERQYLIGFDPCGVGVVTVTT